MIFSRWFHPKTILLKLRMWFWLSLNAILKVRAGLGTFFENSFEILMKNAIRDCWKKLRTSENPIHHILLSKECIWNVFTTGNIVSGHLKPPFLPVLSSSQFHILYCKSSLGAFILVLKVDYKNVLLYQYLKTKTSFLDQPELSKLFFWTFGFLIKSIQNIPQ